MKRLIALFTACAVILTGCAQSDGNTVNAFSVPADGGASPRITGNAESSGSPASSGSSGGSESPASIENTASAENTASTESSGSTEVTGSTENTENTTAGSAADTSAPQSEASAAGTSAGTAGTTASAETTAGTTSGTTAVQTAAAERTAEKTTAVPSANTAGKLSAYSTRYEGREQTSEFNYGEALQKSILFYDLQRSGDLPDDLRCNWRGDSCLNDGKDAGLDLSGGFYDAGDHVKFNLPMSYTTTMLTWSVLEDVGSYRDSGQLPYILDVIRWGSDYFIKCHPEPNVYYYQVGEGGADHGWWGSAEVLEAQMSRPCYKVDMNNGGSTVAASTAASLASCAALFKGISETKYADAGYAEKCLKHAKELFDYAETVKSDAGYTAANGFYNSHSGYTDQLAWAAYWLFKATGDNAYLEKSKKWLDQSGCNVQWAHCWDDVSMGTALLLAAATNDSKYKKIIEDHLNYWINGIKYTPKGLAWLDMWGSLRYSTTTAFLALSYAESPVCEYTKKASYEQFGKKQIDYALGSSGRSFVVGYGTNPPKNPHHRTAHGSYTNNIGDPAETRHTLFGALVGGPDSGDGYTDDRSNYTNNEVACDYNAGFTGALSKLYKDYGGKTLVDFGAVEKPDEEELYADATVNVNGQDFIEVKALVCNKTATPARVTRNLKLCYFFDISEVIAAGGSADDLVVTTNYMQGGSASGVNCWNKDKNLYYVAIDFTGVDIFPGSQDSYKKEVQFRIRNTKGVWDNTNDPSYIDIASVNSGSLVKAKNMALYEGSRLVFGTEPNESNTGVKISEVSGSGGGGQDNQNDRNDQGGGNAQPNREQPSGPAENVSDKGTVSVSLSQQATKGNNNTISFTIKVTNTGSTGIDLSKLTIDYFFTRDGGGDLNFWCDYADISGSGYQACTDKVTGKFSAASGSQRDTKCTMSAGGVLAGGDTLMLQVRITKSDWSDFDLGNDYSSGKSENIKITYNGKELS